MKDDKDGSRLYAGIFHPVKWFNNLIPLSSLWNDYEISADGIQFAWSDYDNSIKYIETFHIFKSISMKFDDIRYKAEMDLYKSRSW